MPLAGLGMCRCSERLWWAMGGGEVKWEGPAKVCRAVLAGVVISSLALILGLKPLGVLNVLGALTPTEYLFAPIAQ